MKSYDRSLYFRISLKFVNPWPNIFGGVTNNSVHDKTIARLDEKSFRWDRVGKLNKGRSRHSMIERNGEILVIGGDSKFKTERCNYQDDGQMHCIEQDPKLSEYAFYPELFPVPDDFCKE